MKHKNILKAAPSVDFDPEYTSGKMYLNEIRSQLHELKAHNIDLLEENTAGHYLISHVVFDKFPVILRRELVDRISNNYPTITDIFSNYNEAIKTLSKTTFVKKKSVNKPFVKVSSGTSNSFKHEDIKESKVLCRTSNQ